MTATHPLHENKKEKKTVLPTDSCMISTLYFQIIKKLIERKQSQIRKVYPGLTCFKEGVRQIPVESIPGISESLSADKLKMS